MRRPGPLGAQPLVVGGHVGTVGGLGLQFLALAIGPLIVVQTTMVASIVATTLAEWLLLRRRPGRRRWGGMVLTGLGLATVLLALSPTVATVAVTPSAAAIVVLAGITLAVSAFAALRARIPPRREESGCPSRPASATASPPWPSRRWVPSSPRDGPCRWAIPPCGPHASSDRSRSLLSQHALRRARAVAAAVSVIVVIDPLVGLLAGVSGSASTSSSPRSRSHRPRRGGRRRRRDRARPRRTPTPRPRPDHASERIEDRPGRVVASGGGTTRP